VGGASVTAAGKITEVKNGRICIIDPDDTLFQSINGALKSMGYETTSAKTGLEGLERIRHSFYELIIVAAAMPDMNVAEFLRNMREVQHDVNIPSSFVIITGNDERREGSREALKMGAGDYITKPFVIERVIDTVEYTFKLIRSEKIRQGYSKELAATQDTVKTLRDELTRSQQLTSTARLVSYMGHTLRNPLTTVKNVAYIFNRMTRKELVDQKLFFAFTALLSTGVEAANSVLTDLLGFADHITLPVTSAIDLSQLIDDACTDVPETKTIKILKHIDAQCKEVLVDREKMKTVFINLINHMLLPANKAAQLTFHAVKTATLLHISISDNGTGVDATDLVNIFEPRFDTATKGVGLELPLARGIVELHNGNIQAESTMGKGSKFVITLPV